MPNDNLTLFRAQAQAELNRLEAQASAKDVAGKAIGKWGLLCITIIVGMGIGASIVLDQDKIAAVMGLLGAALTALISMLNGIAGATPKQEKPEFEIIKSLITKSDQPMNVVVQDGKVTVSKGNDKVETSAT